MIDIKVLEEISLRRKIAAILQIHGNWPLFFGTIGGALGTIFCTKDPIGTFTLFAWVILTMYFILVLFCAAKA